MFQSNMVVTFSNPEWQKELFSLAEDIYHHSQEARQGETASLPRDVILPWVNHDPALLEFLMEKLVHEVMTVSLACDTGKLSCFTILTKANWNPDSAAIVFQFDTQFLSLAAALGWDGAENEGDQQMGLF